MLASDTRMAGMDGGSKSEVSYKPPVSPIHPEVMLIESTVSELAAL